jgi:hypothetical protein
LKNDDAEAGTRKTARAFSTPIATAAAARMKQERKEDPRQRDGRLLFSRLPWKPGAIHSTIHGAATMP